MLQNDDLLHPCIQMSFQVATQHQPCLFATARRKLFAILLLLWHKSFKNLLNDAWQGVSNSWICMKGSLTSCQHLKSPGPGFARCSCSVEKLPEEETCLSRTAGTGRARQRRLLPVGLAQSFACCDPHYLVAPMVRSGRLPLPGMSQPAGCCFNAQAHRPSNLTIKRQMSCSNYPGPWSHPETNASHLHLCLQACLIAWHRHYVRHMRCTHVCWDLCFELKRPGSTKIYFC